MDFRDYILQLGERVEKIRDHLLTEEATKNALVLPFIQCLGYDIFNPTEVAPEFIADIGIKKGEKVDYAIMREGKPCMLIECKHIGQNLDLHNSQLFRYFHTTPAKFGILTNGVKYKFFTDLLVANKMDEKPFLEFDITNVKEETLIELKKFHQSYFNAEQISTIAYELKYCNEIRGIMQEDLTNPSDALTRYYIGKVYDGRATDKIVQQFCEYIRRSSSQMIRDMINDRLQSVLDSDQTQKNSATEVISPDQAEAKIVTTTEEIEAYLLIKCILRQHVAVSRISHRDTQSYFSVLLDNNNRKPICRLYLSGVKRHIGLFDSNRNEVRKPIVSIDDILDHTEAMVSTLTAYIEAVDRTQPEVTPLTA